jgi:4-amino-4-deoxy-L-arabinose transferase-like glycosyltransferase
MFRPRPPVRRQTYVLVYALIAIFMVLAHGPILDAPFYWDETGQFIPASLDLYRTGTVIPHSTLPNVHPPGVMAYLAAFWHVFGFSIPGTRVAMLLLASLGALFTFLLAIELSRDAPGAPALTALALLCVSPLFFAQSMLAQLDMPAMCFAILALLLFLQDRFRASALACVGLVLAKETGVVAVALFGLWLIAEKRFRQATWYALPVAALALWLLALKVGTGHWMGNAEFTRYNLSYPLNPGRLGVALVRRLYYLFISSGHIIGTAALIWAWRRLPLLRSRPWRVAAAFVAVNTVTVSALGGAVLERYLLPVLPVIYIAFAIALRALLPKPRKWAVPALMACLVAASFINPIYPFPYENNLAFLSFVDLERKAAASIESRPGIVATTFPMSNALLHPEFGYVDVPRQVVELKSFHRSEVTRLGERRPDMMLVYDTEWDPLHLLGSAPSQWLLHTFYNFERQLTPEEVASALSMQVVRTWNSQGLKMALLVRDGVPAFRVSALSKGM